MYIQKQRLFLTILEETKKLNKLDIFFHSNLKLVLVNKVVLTSFSVLQSHMQYMYILYILMLPSMRNNVLEAVCGHKRESL